MLEEEERGDKDAEEEEKAEGAEEKAAREKAEYERDAALRQKRFADHMRVSPGVFFWTGPRGFPFVFFVLSGARN